MFKNINYLVAFASLSTFVISAFFFLHVSYFIIYCFISRHKHNHLLLYSLLLLIIIAVLVYLVKYLQLFIGKPTFFDNETFNYLSLLGIFI